MIRTRVGYAGGTTRSPTYHNIGDHSETIQIDYDPSRISYEELLAIFWDTHSPTFPSSRQYMSIIFYDNDEQKIQALASRDREEAQIKSKLYTEIIPAGEFYLAEDYHQKYYLRQMSKLGQELQTIYPATEDFINSTAAARVNGYVGGYGLLTTLEEEIDSLGLSPSGKEKLLKTFRSLEQMGLTQCPVPEELLNPK